MTQHDVEVPTADGVAPASLHVPDGDGPWPAVIMYPDAAGLRAAHRDMAEHLAGLGYVTLVPDVYYRDAPWAPFDAATVFADSDERARLFALMGTVTPEVMAADARAFIDFVLARPETTGGPVGTTGYCMGGRTSMIVAGRLGEAIGAAASFHGGGLAVADSPESPHLRAGDITATVYVAGAVEDQSFTDDQRELLEAALTEAGVSHLVETYPAHHGFAVPDNDTYDEAAASRHWKALADFFGRTLT
ncbi:carboxymethylenebutenolidase [Nakamurella sp. UYEF19]|uniref:dienelactone hydrolase family protein n=1 Tax=Nakamurella sp. UYEF19 TaxID=1756392 RepID=UPI0033910A36